MLNIFNKPKKRILIPNSTPFTEKELKAINGLVQDVAGTLDLDEVLQRSTDAIVDSLKLYGCVLFLLDSNNKYAYTQTISQSKQSRIALKLLKVDNFLDKLKVSLSVKENLIVDSIINNKVNISSELWKYTIGVLNKGLVDLIQTITLTGSVISLPITYKEKNIGALMLTKLHKNDDFQEELPLISLYATQIGIAITNAKLFKDTENQLILLATKNRDLESLYKLTNAVGQSLDPSLVAQLAVDSLPQDKSMVGSIILKYDALGRKAWPIAVTENSLSKKIRELIGSFEKFSLSIDEPNDKNNPTIKAILTGEVQYTSILADAFSPPIPKHFMPVIEAILNVKSALIYPIKARGQIIGTITYLLKEKNYEELEENEKQLYETYTYQIAIALENSNLFNTSQIIQKNLEARNRQMEIIYDFTNKVTSTFNTDQITQHIMDEIPHILGYTAGFYYPVNKEAKTIKPAYHTANTFIEKSLELLPRSFNDYSVPYDNPDYTDNINVKAFNEGKIILTDKIEDLGKHILPETVTDQMKALLDIKTVAAVPIRRENEIVAILDFIIQDKKPEEISKLELDTLSVISNQIGISLENSDLYERTKKALLEVQNAYDRDKDMIDILGHELRTPATICRGNIELLIDKVKNSNIPQENKYYLTKKLQAAFGAIMQETGLINELLSATKLDSGQLVITNEMIDLYEMAKTAYTNYLEIAHKQQLDLRFIEPVSKIPSTIGDRIRIGEVIDNLVSNSIKYTKTGFVEIYLDNDENNVNFHIKDSGMGIPAEEKSNLFQKFHRVDNYIGNNGTKLVRPGGTGLGLYVSKGIVEAHKGNIWVDSEGQGKGSIFSFSLPIRELNTDKVENQEFDMFEKFGYKKKTT